MSSAVLPTLSACLMIFTSSASHSGAHGVLVIACTPPLGSPRRRLFQRASQPWWSALALSSPEGLRTSGEVPIADTDRRYGSGSVRRGSRGFSGGGPENGGGAGPPL